MSEPRTPIPATMTREFYPFACVLMDGESVPCGRLGCDMHLVHPTAVTVNRGGVVTVIDEDGERIDPGRAPSGRGVMIRLDFCCECGHAFAIVYQFHKGETFVLRHWTENPTAQEDGDYCRTIWRD